LSMIAETPGSQVGSPVAAEESREVRGGGRGESGGKRVVRSKSTPKARSKSRTDKAMNEAPRIFPRMSVKLPTLAIWYRRHCHRQSSKRLRMYRLDCNVDICVYIGFLGVGNKARGGTTSRGTRRGAVIQRLTLCQHVGTMTRRQWYRSRSN